ncbi:hypothetical protein [Natrinema salifodinae]|uniref:Uncharacterized protein n=1 Tax=Natrinema salifodinae TaxID=1202768 RepID=A0A1I0NLD5_9EURY|nr:hypothetical protein [Natrinema salifodinae]SEW02223.1 hypothetical protein SAMN05216285_1871 [Natrinema salifodinae]
MDLRNPLRWTLVYRAIAVGALGLGLALVAVGLLVGFGSSITALLADPLNPGPALERADPTITVAFTVLGVVVWQLGKTYALFVTLPRATGRAAAQQLDSTRLASEVRDGLDDRLAELEAEVEATRRTVDALETDERVATFDEDRVQDAAAGNETPELESGVESRSSETAPLPPSSPSNAPVDAADTDAGSGDGGDSADGASVDSHSTDDDRDDPLA